MALSGTKSIKKTLWVGLAIPFLFTVIVSIVFAFQVKHLLTLSTGATETDKTNEETLLKKQQQEVLSVARTTFFVTASFATVLGAIFLLIFQKVIKNVSKSYEALFKKQQALAAKLEESRNELEAKISERTLSLGIINQELEAFCYSVSHDLRAPLRGIDGFSKALMEDYQDSLDERAQKYIAYVRQGTQKMGQLISDLLNLSRLSREEMTTTTVNLSEQAKEIAERLNRECSPSPVVAFKIDEEMLVQGDPILLGAALENLFSNAWKFSANQHQPMVNFGVKSSGSKKIYFIEDNGAGFDMAYYSKLFGVFQRLHSTREFTGTGVGLATVRRIINRHGGAVWAESKVGEGATFYFTLEDETRA